MIKILRREWLLVTLFSTAILFSQSCHTPDETGLEVLPDQDQIGGIYTDTFNVILRTLPPDSSFTLNRSLNLVGNYLDPELGRVSAEIYSQFRMPGTNLVFANNPARLSLDSIVLSLDITDFYCRYDDPLDLEVFRITDDLNQYDSLWSSSYIGFDSSFNYAAGKQINFQGKAGFFDWIDIRLDDSLGNKLLFAPNDSLVDNSTFTNFFPGLCIRTKPVKFYSREPGGIFTVDLRSAKTVLKLYYTDSLRVKSYAFVVNDNAQRVNRFVRSAYSSSLLSIAIADSSNSHTQYGVVQSGALVKLAVYIPGLDSLPALAANRAELELPIDPSLLGSSDRLIPPTDLYLFLADASGKKEIDPNTYSAVGTYSNTLKKYIFPLTNTIHQIVDGRAKNNGFIIVPGVNGVTVNRTILGGSGNPMYAPRLKLVYTPVPQ